MKRLLSVGAIALTLTFSANAEAPSHLALMPSFEKCIDLLRLESLQRDPENKGFRINRNDPNQMELLHRYFEVVGWLRGFFTEMNNVHSMTGLTPDVTKSTQEKDWMPWIYSYCRSHPTDNIEDVALELAKALSGSGSLSGSSSKDGK